MTGKMENTEKEQLALRDFIWCDWGKKNLKPTF